MTRTYSTTRIALDTQGRTIWVEDLSYVTPDEVTNPMRERVERLLEPGRVRVFPDWLGFTTWLQEVGAVVEQCYVLGPTLSDEERQVWPDR